MFSAEEIYREINDYQDELNEKQLDEIRHLAADHIGLFLRWIIERGYERKSAETFAECQRVRRGELSGVDYFLKNCGGKFREEDINEEIFPFVKEYYPRYVREYTRIIAEGNCFTKISNEEEYAKMRRELDMAYRNYKENY